MSKTTKKYLQTKELPFKNEGSIWEIEWEYGGELYLNIDGENYTYCSPGLHTNLVRYYFDLDSGLDMTADGYFKEIE